MNAFCQHYEPMYNLDESNYLSHSQVGCALCALCVSRYIALHFALAVGTLRCTLHSWFSLMNCSWISWCGRDASWLTSNSSFVQLNAFHKKGSLASTYLKSWNKRNKIFLDNHFVFMSNLKLHAIRRPFCKKAFNWTLFTKIWL